MASLFGHTTIALAASALLPRDLCTRRVLGLAVVVSMLPDADVCAFLLGIPYGSPWGHRGFTHSVAFAAGIGPVIAWSALPRTAAGSRTALLSFFFAAVCASHLVLDAMTSGGLGVAAFWPFDGGRYFLPFRPLRVSPIWVGAFVSQEGLAVLESKLMVVALPCAVLVVLARARR